MKQALRKKIAVLRGSIPEQERVSKSLEIEKALFSLPEFQKAKRVLFYASFRSEVETKSMIEDSLKLGKTILLPKVKGKLLELREIKNFEKETCKGSLGIPEPIDSAKAFQPEALDLMIVPGLAFDLKGNRLGFGKGYYDRLLSGIKGILAIGIAFNLQVVESLPEEKHDRKVGILVTEKGILRF